jgi:hypothetical protein
MPWLCMVRMPSLIAAREISGAEARRSTKSRMLSVSGILAPNAGSRRP